MADLTGWLRRSSKMLGDANRLQLLTTIPPSRSPVARHEKLPLVDSALLEAISRYLDERMTLKKPLKPNDPLLLPQKGGF